jgi:hypothetical protein
MEKKMKHSQGLGKDEQMVAILKVFTGKGCSKNIVFESGMMESREQDFQMFEGRMLWVK